MSPGSGRLGEAPRARDRRGRPDAVPPGRVAGGGDDPPALPRLRVSPDDDRPSAELRVAPLLHRGEEGVHVEMGDDPHGARIPSGTLANSEGASHSFDQPSPSSPWRRSRPQTALNPARLTPLTPRSTSRSRRTVDPRQRPGSPEM